ncbi:MAG TPA: hypothetical protein VL418_02230 [Devosiaceae bacterium]|nr:hypothetical protein [Devosiaceae bacterium]
MSISLALPFSLMAAILAASPALAEAVTYQGTLGKANVIVELSAPVETASGKFAGRYSYAIKGIDIPLDAQSVAPGKVDLAEEQPCTDKICHTTDDGDPAGPAPLGGRWHLESAPGGQTLTGTWSDGGKSLPIALARYGTRKLAADFDGTPATLASNPFTSGEGQLTKAISPYDFLKMQVPLKAAAPTTWGSVAFTYVTDPRTKFKFPRIVSLGGADVTAANDYLAQQHWMLNGNAFACESTAYQGLGWNDSIADAAGSLGGYDDETLEVSYLSATVMSWVESGSLFCGGAHPDNHRDVYNLDVRTGKPLDMSLVFKDWVPTPLDGGAPKDAESARAHPDQYTWGPDQALVDFVLAHRKKLDDPDLENDCGSSGAIHDSLALSFAEGDKVRFSLAGMPNVDAVCDDDLFELPIASVKSLLTPKAADYFPALKAQ